MATLLSVLCKFSWRACRCALAHRRGSTSGIGLVTDSEDPFEQGDELLHAISAPPLSGSTGRSALASLLSFFYGTLLTVLVVPIVLHYVSSTGYGLFAVASVFVGFLSMLDIGIGEATTRFVSEHIARSRDDLATTTLRVSVLLYGVIGLIGASVAVGLGVFASTALARGASPATASAVFVVAGCGFFITMLENAMVSAVSARQEFVFMSQVTAVLATLGAILTICLLALGGGVIGLIVASSCQSLIGLLIYTIRVRTWLPGFVPVPSWDAFALRQIAKFTGYSFLASIGGSILLQFDKLALGALAGTQQVTYYVVPANIAQRVHLSMASMNAVVLPATTTLATANDHRRVARLYVRAARYTGCLLVVFAVPPAILSHRLLVLWVGPEVAHHASAVFILLIMTYTVLAIGVPAYYVALGLNQPRVTAAFHVVMALLNVPLVLLLVKPAGARGAAIAYLIAVTPTLFFVAYVERRLLRLDGSPWPSLAARLIPVALIETCVALAVSAVLREPAGVIVALAASIASGPVAYLALRLATEEDKQLVRAARNRLVLRALRARGRRG